MTPRGSAAMLLCLVLFASLLHSTSCKLISENPEDLPSSVSDWKCHHLGRWLQQQPWGWEEAGDYAEQFCKVGVTGQVVGMLDDEDLEELGITSKIRRKILSYAFRHLKQQSSKSRLLLGKYSASDIARVSYSLCSPRWSMMLTFISNNIHAIKRTNTTAATTIQQTCPTGQQAMDGVCSSIAPLTRLGGLRAYVNLFAYWSVWLMFPGLYVALELFATTSGYPWFNIFAMLLGVAGGCMDLYLLARATRDTPRFGVRMMALGCCTLLMPLACAVQTTAAYLLHPLLPSVLRLVTTLYCCTIMPLSSIVACPIIWSPERLQELDALYDTILQEVMGRGGRGRHRGRPGNQPAQVRIRVNLQHLAARHRPGAGQRNEAPADPQAAAAGAAGAAVGAIVAGNRHRDRPGVHWPPPLEIPPELEECPDVPDPFRCPISMSVMREPTQSSAGVSYDRWAIVRWLEDHRTDPVTNLTLRRRHLSPNLALRQIIEQWVRYKTSQHNRPELNGPTAAADPITSALISNRIDPPATLSEGSTDSYLPTFPHSLTPPSFSTPVTPANPQQLATIAATDMAAATAVDTEHTDDAEEDSMSTTSAPVYPTHTSRDVNARGDARGDMRGGEARGSRPPPAHSTTPPPAPSALRTTASSRVSRLPWSAVPLRTPTHGSSSSTAVNAINPTPNTIAGDSNTPTQTTVTSVAGSPAAGLNSSAGITPPSSTPMVQQPLAVRLEMLRELAAAAGVRLPQSEGANPTALHSTPPTTSAAAPASAPLAVQLAAAGSVAAAAASGSGVGNTSGSSGREPGGAAGAWMTSGRGQATEMPAVLRIPPPASVGLALSSVRGGGAQERLTARSSSEEEGLAAQEALEGTTGSSPTLPLPSTINPHLFTQQPSSTLRAPFRPTQLFTTPCPSPPQHTNPPSPPPSRIAAHPPPAASTPRTTLLRPPGTPPPPPRDCHSRSPTPSPPVSESPGCPPALAPSQAPEEGAAENTAPKLDLQGSCGPGCKLVVRYTGCCYICPDHGQVYSTQACAEMCGYERERAGERGEGGAPSATGDEDCSNQSEGSRGDDATDKGGEERPGWGDGWGGDEDCSNSDAEPQGSSC